MGRLDFIGKHENRVDELERLSDILDIKINTELHLNATEPNGEYIKKEKILTNKKIMNRLHDLLILDIKFYDMYSSKI